MKRWLFHGWIIVGAGVLLSILTYGIRSSFPVFYLPIMDEFGGSRASTALIFSIALLFFGLASPFAGALVDRFGPRNIIAGGVLLLAIGAAGCSQARAVWHLYFFFGVLVSVGLCLSGWVPFSVVISRWFVRKRGTALGIYMTSGSLSNLVTFLVQYLISSLGWRHSFLVLAVLPLVMVVPVTAFVLHSRPEDIGLVPDGDPAPGGQTTGHLPAEALVVDKDWASRNWTLPQALSTARFWMLWGAFFCWTGVGLNILMAHQVAFAVDMGYSQVLAASVFVFFGLSGTLGYLLGFISDRIGRELTFALGSLLAIVAVILLLLVRDAHHPWLLYGYGVLMGWGWSLAMPAITATVVDLFQGRHFGAIMGSAVSGFGVGGLLGPWLAGFIFDRMGSYDLAFILVLAMFLVSVVLVWLAAPHKVRRMPGRAPRTC